ncbi:DUF6970 domain-containing protein [Polaribacter sp. R77954]|uniref:DUF6970 domain-containing protein n=1 Tax=Polaribacter sp. R77954 TaxID=3093870 RepID=UPI0037C6E022
MKISFIFLAVFFIVSCASNNPVLNQTCKVDLPIEDLIWLKAIKENFEKSVSLVKKEIILYEYNNAHVFLIDDCNNCADNLSRLYNCEGTIICEFGGIAGVNTCADFEKNAIKIRVLWEN